MAGQDFRVPMVPLLRAFGVAATVTRPAPDDTPIDTDGVWVPIDTVALPPESDWQRRDELKVMAFDRNVVPTLPTGSFIEAPERKGDLIKVWIVDGQADSHGIDADQVKAVVRFYGDPGT